MKSRRKKARTESTNCIEKKMKERKIRRRGGKLKWPESVKTIKQLNEKDLKVKSKKHSELKNSE